MDKKFDCENNKETIIKISCHYNYTNPEFIKIKNNLKDVDNKIKANIQLHINELYEL